MARRRFILQGGAALVGGVLGRAASTAPSSLSSSFGQSRRLIIDSHQHFSPAPDYLDRLVRIYRPRRAMACVLTRVAHLETVRRAAAEHPDVIIPYGQINVDDTSAVR